MRHTKRAGPTGSDRARLQAIQRGDRAAFGTLYEEYVRDVYHYALRMLRDTAGAEDITQDVFILAWTKRAEIRVVDVSLLPWLLAATRNLSLNRLKRKSYSATLDGSTEMIDPRPGPEDVLLDRQLGASIATAVARLSESDQKLYRLCLVDELSYRDAAHQLETTAGAVRNRLTRLRRTLRISLASQNEGLS
ncbi:sigma-70 family RNA polymerase sigma factor [Cryobacterium frigoriphilum]|uniref:Sigma-70 family RNA polymerase sigma factor n=1 Tax=Cryobacterium frigoriphilum TaxID=1259150 RepID=A0A4R9A010_9MICO|nr:sigma-70 family RNA polymerase sigma factor [Cryobacterium frigoriphilum]TFD49597.1 sigma-70 family RNA polymerase sigma factor [Cryobacterium frigoriphilum]